MKSNYKVKDFLQYVNGDKWEEGLIFTGVCYLSVIGFSFSKYSTCPFKQI